MLLDVGMYYIYIIYVKKAQRHAKARYFKSPPRKVVIEILWKKRAFACLCALH